MLILSDRFSILFVVEWILRGSKMCSSAAFHAQFDFRAILVLPIFFYHFAFLKRKGAYKRSQKKETKRESPHYRHGLYKMVACNLWRHLIYWGYLRDVIICHLTKTYRNTCFKEKLVHLHICLFVLNEKRNYITTLKTIFSLIPVNMNFNVTGISWCWNHFYTFWILML